MSTKLLTIPEGHRGPHPVLVNRNRRTLVVLEVSRRLPAGLRGIGECQSRDILILSSGLLGKWLPPGCNAFASDTGCAKQVYSSCREPDSQLAQLRWQHILGLASILSAKLRASNSSNQAMEQPKAFKAINPMESD
ncbi:electron transfer flavoprotein subunit beta [Anopheles sinensis]|uniref:Electron transfer flavoprotein subunit beta n=1 Tax=Anopheles sinensis TaxID=74873 RepID=A0A084VGB5_ANOSI|nr:electron transfer flavoprotein subunit beta [Anopheles sinensis]